MDESTKIAAALDRDAMDEAARRVPAMTNPADIRAQANGPWPNAPKAKRGDDEWLCGEILDILEFPCGCKPCMGSCRDYAGAIHAIRDLLGFASAHAARVWADAERDEAQGQIERLDRENARLRLELAAAKLRLRTAEQRLRGITFHTNDAGELIRIDERDDRQQVVRVMWEKRAQRRDGVIHVEPFPDVQPDTSAPFPPAHRPRMLP